MEMRLRKHRRPSRPPLVPNTLSDSIFAASEGCQTPSRGSRGLVLGRILARERITAITHPG